MKTQIYLHPVAVASHAFNVVADNYSEVRCSQLFERLNRARTCIILCALIAFIALGPAAHARDQDTHQLAGLWVGAVSLDAVSQPNSDSPAQPVPTGSEFLFPLILHVDGGGSVRILKEVVLLWERAKSADTPGRTLLLTDTDMLRSLDARELPSGRRISSAAFDFAGTAVELGGSPTPGSTLSGVIEVPADLPTNPFAHRYHPDHDDPEEIYAVSRRLELALETASTEPLELAGSYREALGGLHRQTLHVSGRFDLRRASRTPWLNQ